MREGEVLYLDRTTRADRRAGLAGDVLWGLSQHPKRLPSKYLYDAAGSALFERISTLEEYYPTRCEQEILERHGAELVAPLPPGPCDVVDLGAGDGHKAHLLLEALLRGGRDVRYVPVDVCPESVLAAAAGARRRSPGVSVLGVVSEYAAGLQQLREQGARSCLVLFLGSSIGNFAPPEAITLLAQLRRSMRAGDLALVGFDLKKDIDLLMRAYNDREGVTAEFNRNLLRRLNRELGATFDLARFRHFGTYNPSIGAMESFLISDLPQEVEVALLRRSFRFAAWEPIHTEQSFKFDLEELDPLAEAVGFEPVATRLDSRRYFVDVVWRAPG